MLAIFDENNDDTDDDYDQKDNDENGVKPAVGSCPCQTEMFQHVLRAQIVPLENIRLG